jgi:hypothetical protein
MSSDDTDHTKNQKRGAWREWIARGVLGGLGVLTISGYLVWPYLVSKGDHRGICSVLFKADDTFLVLIACRWVDVEEREDRLGTMFR